jgi:hypothetical protein
MFGDCRAAYSESQDFCAEKVKARSEPDWGPGFFDAFDV